MKRMRQMNHNGSVRIVLFAAVLLSAALFLSGCSGTPSTAGGDLPANLAASQNTAAAAGTDQTGTSAAVQNTTVNTTDMNAADNMTENTTAEPVIPAGSTISPLDGSIVTEETAMLRPFAVMINNIKAATPQQCGTSEAKIVYEILAEGGITRLMCIFEGDTDVARLGSCRSARHYFVSIASEYDAIYCHYGHTKYATAKIAELGVNNLSGLSSYEKTVYYRDHHYRAPHNVFTSGDMIRAGIKRLKYSSTLSAPITNHFDFNAVDTDLEEGGQANKIVLGFSTYTSPYFKYDAKNKVYKRWQYGAKHLDANTGKQLRFKNIIIQLVKEWNIDHNGYQTMDIENSAGDGYYITNGTYVPITWEKNEGAGTMTYYSETGEKLSINPGKTYIAVYPKDRTDKLKITAE